MHILRCSKISFFKKYSKEKKPPTNRKISWRVPKKLKKVEGDNENYIANDTREDIHNLHEIILYFHGIMDERSCRRRRTKGGGNAKRIFLSFSFHWMRSSARKSKIACFRNFSKKNYSSIFLNFYNEKVSFVNTNDKVLSNARMMVSGWQEWCAVSCIISWFD